MRVKSIHFCYPELPMKYFLLLLSLCLLSSCQTGKTGTLTVNKQLSSAFENCEVLPGYTYYYSGPVAQPDVILAVKKEYNFEQGLWQPAQISQKMLCDWMAVIDPEYRNARYRYDAYTIYSADRKELGIWYSTENHAVIKEQPDKLIIYTPNIRQNYRRMSRDIDNIF